MTTYSKRNDTKCPYCSANQSTLIKIRKPGQKIFKCNETNCLKHFMIQNETKSFPLLDPNDENSLPGNVTKI